MNAIGTQLAYGGDTKMNKWDAAAELRRNPVSKNQMQPEYGNEQADAGRDCRTRLARLNSQARTRTGKNIHFPCSADHEQDWQPYPVDPYCINSYMFDLDYCVSFENTADVPDHV